LIIWCCIHGSNQLLNVILHAQGLTSDDCDQVHSNQPEYCGSTTPEVDEVMATMQAIEGFGPRFVRGNEPWAVEEGEQCLSLYARVKQIAATVYRGGEG
jgi:hypothetical protein